MREEERRRLEDLYAQKRALEEEIARLEARLARSSSLSKEEKIALFHRRFIGNEEAYALHWVSRDGSKSGYAPATRTFRGKDYLPVNGTIIRRHLEGKVRMGSYAIRRGNLCVFLAIDLDKGSYLEDARALEAVCRRHGLSPAFELSKSGQGIHLWIFFSEPVEAWRARALGDRLLSEAMDRAEGIDLSSFDRFFPHQDFVPEGSLGNLIALPLHYGSRQEGKTLFIDLETLRPFADQWGFLQRIPLCTPDRLVRLTRAAELARGEERKMPWELHPTPLSFPRKIEVVLFDGIYLRREDLPRSLFNHLRRLASFYNPEFFLRQRRRLSTYRIPRIVSGATLNERYLVLPRGLWEEVRTLLEEGGVSLRIEDRRIEEPAEIPPFHLTLRPEQREAFEALKEKESAVLVAVPGFGKTVVAAALIAHRRVSTLVLVHKTALLEQWRAHLAEYLGLEEKAIGMLGKGKRRLNGMLDVVTLQSLRKRPELVEAYSQIVVDEAHHVPAVSFELPLRSFRGRYILGLSATPRRRDGMEAILFQQCGKIAYRYEGASDRFHRLLLVPTAFESLADHYATLLGELAEEEARNRQIVEMALRFRSRRILVLSERIEHLRRLAYLMEAAGLQPLLIHGTMSAKTRREEFGKSAQSSLILSTSGFMGEGVDLGHLDTLFLTMPIAYSERLVQYLGRIGRSGQECLAVDFVDEKVPMLAATLRKRMKGYRKMGYRADEGPSLFDPSISLK